MERPHRDDAPWEEIELTRPPARLLSQITNRIRIERKLQASRKKAVYFLIALGGSLAALAGTFIALHGAFVQSEFFETLSLLYSDPEVIMANLNSFALSLLESLPALNLLFFFGALFLSLEALRGTVRHAALLFSSAKLIKR